MAVVTWSTRRIEWPQDLFAPEPERKGLRMILSDLKVYEGTRHGIIFVSERRHRHWADRGALGVIVSVGQAVRAARGVADGAESEVLGQTARDATAALTELQRAFGG